MQLLKFLLLGAIIFCTQSSFGQKKELVGTYKHRFKPPPKDSGSIISRIHIISHLSNGQLTLYPNKKFKLTYPYFHAWKMCDVTASYKGKYSLEGDTVVLKTRAYEDGAGKKRRDKEAQSSFQLLLLANGNLKLLDIPHEFYQKEND